MLRNKKQSNEVWKQDEGDCRNQGRQYGLNSEIFTSDSYGRKWDRKRRIAGITLLVIPTR